MKNKIILLTLFLLIPSLCFGESIKISFSMKSSSKYKGLNSMIISFVSSKPLYYGSKTRDGKTDYNRVGISFNNPDGDPKKLFIRKTDESDLRKINQIKQIIAHQLKTSVDKVDLTDGLEFGTLGTISRNIEEIFIINDYSLTYKSEKRKDDPDLVEYESELHFKK